MQYLLINYENLMFYLRSNFGNIESIYSMDPRLSVSPRFFRTNIRPPQDVQGVYNAHSIVVGNAGDEPKCVNSTNDCVIENTSGFIDTIN